MGKQKRVKAHHTHQAPRPSSLFPFNLLQWWFKPISSDELCQVCHQAPVVCAAESYLDASEYLRLVESGLAAHEATNRVWSKGLAEQTAGHYTNSLTSHLCKECAYHGIEAHVGEKTAVIAAMPLLLLQIPGSLVLGCRLLTPQDDGRNFAAGLPASVQSIDDVATLMRKETVGIKLD